MKRYIILFFFVFITFNVSAGYADTMRIAIIDLQGKEVSKILANAVTDLIRSDMVDSGLFTVIERTQMNAILKEQELQMTGCTDSSCAVKVGKLLSARKILVGEITMINKSFLITIRVVDVEKGVAEFSSKESAAGEDELEKASSRLTLKLIGRITGKMESELIAGLDRKTETGYYLRGIVPGWGQFYADRTIKGYIFLGAFIFTAGFTGYSIYDFYQKKSAYDESGLSQSEYNSRWDKYQKAADLTLYSAVAFGAVYVINWVDLLFFSKPDFNNTSVSLFNDSSRFISFDIINSGGNQNEAEYIFMLATKF